jgi:hypothetical protein
VSVATPKFFLTTPQAVEIDNVPQWIQSLATQLDGLLAGCQSGVIASIPAASAGRFYYATDTLQLYLSDGVVWRSIMGLPTRPMGRWYMPGTTGGGGSGLVGITDLYDGTTPKLIPWTADFQTNGFATSGSTIVTPAKGIYRVHIQCCQLPSWQLSSTEQIEHRIMLFQGQTSGNPPGEPFGQTHLSSQMHQVDGGVSTNMNVSGAPTRAGGYPTSELTGVMMLDGSFSSLTKLQVLAYNSTVYGGPFGSAIPCFQLVGGREFTFLEIEEIVSLA